ncbi:hypothetical protein [Pseudoalteromonas sp. NCIMB_1079]|uniref:hypothetical protein n=1 Tax=Pseudoalteromonas sp. NCIMB 1079 TaxID=3142847 RepID=UPI00339CF1EF
MNIGISLLRNKEHVVAKSIELNDFKIGFEFEIDYLKKYVDRLAEPVNDMLDSLEFELASNLDSNPDLAEQIDESYFIEAAKIKSYFYNSLIVLTYTVYESSLQKLSELIKLQTSSKLCYTQLKNSNVSEKSLLFIKLLTGVCGKSDNATYSRLREFQNLRNKIAHQNSQVQNLNETERHAQLNTMRIAFNRGLRDGDEPKLIVNLDSGDFSINSSELIFEFIGLVENNVLRITSELKDIVFTVEQHT